MRRTWRNLAYFQVAAEICKFPPSDIDPELRTVQRTLEEEIAHRKSQLGLIDDDDEQEDYFQKKSIITVLETSAEQFRADLRELDVIFAAGQRVRGTSGWVGGGTNGRRDDQVGGTGGGTNGSSAAGASSAAAAAPLASSTGHRSRQHVQASSVNKLLTEEAWTCLAFQTSNGRVVRASNAIASDSSELAQLEVALVKWHQNLLKSHLKREGVAATTKDLREVWEKIMGSNWADVTSITAAEVASVRDMGGDIEIQRWRLATSSTNVNFLRKLLFRIRCIVLICALSPPGPHPLPPPPTRFPFPSIPLFTSPPPLLPAPLPPEFLQYKYVES